MDDKKENNVVEQQEQHQPLIPDDIMDYIQDVISERIAIEGPVKWE